jgi:hypothetical protein
MPLWGDSKTKKKARELDAGPGGGNSSSNLVVASLADHTLQQSSNSRVVFQSDPTEGEYGLRILHEPADAVVE